MKFIQGHVHWGIIGAGNVCEVKSGPAFNKVPGYSLVAVMRRDREKARDYAERHQVKNNYSRADDLINDPEVNAVYVATPPAFHEEYAIRAMQAGKAVYIEKPVTLDACGCERLIEAEKKYDVPVCVAHYRRALPLFKQVKSIVRDGILGKITMINLRLFQAPDTQMIAKTDVNWRLIPAISGGGLFHDLAPHQLDILYWIFGEASAIKGFSMNQSNISEAPDYASLNMIFEKEIVFTGTWAFNVHAASAIDSCEIAGGKGRIVFSFFGKPILKIQTETRNESIPFINPEHIQQSLIEEVVKYFKGEAANPSPLGDALQGMRMMDAAGRRENNG